MFWFLLLVLIAGGGLFIAGRDDIPPP